MSFHVPRTVTAAAVSAALVAGAVLAGSTIAGAAAAQVAPQATLTGADFPTVTQVAKPYPVFRGGSRDLFPPSRAPIDLPSSDCVGYDSSQVKVQRSRIADYLMRNGEIAYFHGLADPVVAVYLYKKPASAAQAMNELRSDLDQCWGTHGDAQYAVTYHRQAMPRLGNDRFAFRRVVTDSHTGKDFAAETWVRKGRFLVNTRAQRDPGPPPIKPLLRLTRTSVAAAG